MIIGIIEFDVIKTRYRENVFSRKMLRFEEHRRNLILAARDRFSAKEFERKVWKRNGRDKTADSSGTRRRQTFLSSLCSACARGAWHPRCSRVTRTSKVPWKDPPPWSQTVSKVSSVKDPGVLFPGKHARFAFLQPTSVFISRPRHASYILVREKRFSEQQRASRCIQPVVQ